MSQSFPSYPGQPCRADATYDRVAGERELHRETAAAVEARRELGPEYDDAIAAGLADKVEQLVAYRTAELRSESGRHRHQSEAEQTRRTQRFVLGIVSLATGVPITVIAALNVDPSGLGVLISWAGIVGVNIAAAWNGRRGS